MPQSDTASQRARILLATHPNILRLITGVGLLLVALSGWFVYQVLSALPDRDRIRALDETAEGTTVYDAHDRPVFALPTRRRIEVPLDRISQNLQNAIIAVEDVRFYEHDGIDGIRLIGAVIADLRERRAAEGASTITQQLARLSFLTRDKTLRRKVREAILAQQIERLYSKHDILEIYLNKVYFGDGLYGAEAASEGYFGKNAEQLTVAEGALLAGLVRAPSSTNPVANPQRAIERRNLVLKLMREHEFIDAAAYDAAILERVALKDTLRRDDAAGSHYKEVVRRQLLDQFGKDAVYGGRLQVYTAFDPAAQKAAEEAVTTSLAEIDRRIKNASAKEPLQGALIALDPRSGEVRAVVGGRDTESVGFNRALQAKRQPGSAFKPFVYAAALESGYTPATIIDQLDMPVDTLEGAWLPEDEHSTAVSTTMRAALRTSSNRAAVRVLEAVGLDRTVAYASQLGVGAVPNVPSLALGSGEVTLAAITSAYSAFAQAGIVRDPVFIRKVTNQNGEVLYQSDPKPRRAVSESTAFQMASMLADVIDAGTANRARTMGFTSRAAGKTGTTNDFVDAWFVGFTPNLVAGVWVGFDQPRTIIKNGFAGQLAVPMWARFMKEATRNDRNTWFARPSDVVAVKVCRVSGSLPAANCEHAASMSATGAIAYKNMVYTEYFVRGTEPRETCAVHAVQYLPYPEPYVTVTPLDDIGIVVPLPAPPERAVYDSHPPPKPVGTSSSPVDLSDGRHSVTVPVARPPAPPRHLPDQPAGDPEPAPGPAPALPPAAPPEPPPAAVQ